MAAVSHGPFLSSFVGREEELGDVRRLVAAHRLVTLLGVGGLGKTRLAYRAFGELADQFGHAWSVDLADLVEAPLLGHTVAAAMGLPAPAEPHDLSALIDHIGEQPALLLLDNAEHLVDACAGLIVALLERCPGLHVLTTSRQALGIVGEYAYAVPPLAPADAVELFSARATSALAAWSVSDQDRESVADLCSALEGLPLAIELAAVQVRTFSPAAMVERLGGRAVSLGGQLRGEPSRRASMEACVRWSYDLCTAAERLLWARLSVFGGGFSLEDVEETCQGEGVEGDQVVAAVAGLVDKSLLTREADAFDSRFRMLEVIRQFGQARLVESDELTTWRRRHRDHYLRLVERFDAEWTGPDQLAWMDRFRLEQANLRVAFEFSATDPVEAPLAMAMAPVLEHYFASTGGGPEAVHWLLLALGHGTGTPLERASALRVACFIAVLVAQLDTAATFHDELEALAEETADDRIRAYALYAGAMLRTWQGDPVTGAALALDGCALLLALGDVGKEANLHFLRGMMLGWADRPGEAAVAYKECLDLTEPRGERWLTSYSQWGLGVDALMAGQHDESLRLERAALDAKATFGDQLGIGLTTEVIAWIAADQGRGREAAVLLGAAEAIWDAIGMTVAAMPYLSRRREEGFVAARRLLSATEFAAAFEEGRAMPQPEAVALALGRARLVHRGTTELLTRREQEIARLVAVGESNKAIADRLVISVRTVETHVEHVLRKLGVHSRGQVAGALPDE